MTCSASSRDLSRSAAEAVISHEMRKTRHDNPWSADGALDHQPEKLKKSQKSGVATQEVQANATADKMLVSDLLKERGVSRWQANWQHDRRFQKR